MQLSEGLFKSHFAATFKSHTTVDTRFGIMLHE